MLGILIAQRQSGYEKFDILGINFDAQQVHFQSTSLPFLEVGTRQIHNTSNVVNTLNSNSLCL